MKLLLKNGYFFGVAFVVLLMSEVVESYRRSFREPLATVEQCDKVRVQPGNIVVDLQGNVLLNPAKQCKQVGVYFLFQDHDVLPSQISWVGTLIPPKNPLLNGKANFFPIWTNNPFVNVICDSAGNAWFDVGGLQSPDHSRPVSVALATDPKVVSIQAVSGDFSDSVSIDPHRIGDPYVGDGFALAGVVCLVAKEEGGNNNHTRRFLIKEAGEVPLKPKVNNEEMPGHPKDPPEVEDDDHHHSVHGGPNMDDVVLAKIELSTRYSYGYLEPPMMSELTFLIVLLFPKIVLGTWFFIRIRRFREHVLHIQLIFFGTVVFSVISSMVFIVYLSMANAQNFNTCCPTPGKTVAAFSLKAFSNLLFNMLLLMTAKGWGVVRPNLTKSEQRRIALFVAFTILLFILSHTLRPSLEISWLIIMSESFMWIWIFSSLRNTERTLVVSTRLDSKSKLAMYQSLRRLILCSWVFFLLVLFIIITIVVVVWREQNKYVGDKIPPSLSWDLTLLLMMIGFARTWV